MPINSALKINQEMRELEDLVFQISYFAESAPKDYAVKLIKNFARKIMLLLEMEHEDLMDLLEHEHSYHEFEPYTYRKELKHIFDELKTSDLKKIKAEIKKILHACKQEVPPPKFRKDVRAACSQILKILKSEHHELGIVDSLLKVKVPKGKHKHI